MGNLSAPRFEIDFRSTAFAQNPYLTYQLLRERYPVCQLADGTYVLSRYEDVQFALKRYDLFASGWSDAPLAHPGWMRDEYKREPFLTESDPPEHTWYNAIVNKAFIGKSIRMLAPVLEDVSRNLIEKIKNSCNKSNDFLSDFAYPLAGMAISSITGLEIEHQIERIRNWVCVAESFTAECPSPARQAEIEDTLADQHSYYDELITKRNNSPKDDLVTMLINARVEGRKLSEKQLWTALNLFTVAGFQAPAQFLAAAIAFLAHRPDLVSYLRSSPHMIGEFIEELLRLHNAAQGALRTSTTSISLRGITIPPNATVLVLIGSANRDPEQFPDPDNFNFSRDNVRTHIGFGYGAHSCLGAGLARMELKAALGVLLKEFSRFDCAAEDELNWYSTVVGRLLKTLSVEFY